MMDENGVHHPNITCPRCRRRHPTHGTCQHWRDVAQAAATDREPASAGPNDAERFRFLVERFAHAKLSASQRVIDDLRLGESADPCDSLTNIVDAEMLRAPRG